MFGTGFGQGQQKLGYLPYAYCDFLFSTIGEEWGFVGRADGGLPVRAVLLARVPHRRTASDPFGQYLAVGLTATIGLTAFMHMAVSLGLMPTTGLTLPFMSYGRSSQVISLIGDRDPDQHRAAAGEAARRRGSARRRAAEARRKARREERAP